MKYFGTDGIRQPAEKFTPEFLAKIIKGLVDYAGNEIKILLAGDTRESTEWILADLQTACETFGLEYASAGVLPTPAINYCFYQTGFDYAIDVTASHNPYTDNGIKIFEEELLLAKNSIPRLAMPSKKPLLPIINTLQFLQLSEKISIKNVFISTLIISKTI